MQPCFWCEGQGAEVHGLPLQWAKSGFHVLRLHAQCEGSAPAAGAHSRVEVGGYGQNGAALTLWATASSCCSAHSCCWVLSSALYSASLGSSCSQRLRAFCTAVSTYRRWQERGTTRVKFHSNYDLIYILHCVSLSYNHTDFINSKQQSSLNYILSPAKGKAGSGNLYLMSNAVIRSFLQSSVIPHQVLLLLEGKLKYPSRSPSASCCQSSHPPLLAHAPPAHHVHTYTDMPHT